MKCYLCGNTEHLYVKGQVRDNSDIKIRKCSSCGLVFLDDSSHIDDKFYENNGMEKTINLNCNFAQTDSVDTQKRINLYQKKLINKRVLDFGCGSGSFLSRIKKENITSQLYALEPNQKHFNFLNSNFTLYKSIDEIPDKSLDFVTMFHVMEHLKNPLEILQALYNKLDEHGKIIIEIPNCDDALLSLYDNDAFSNFTYWSCHLYLFNNETLKTLLEKTPYKIDYIKQYQRYSFANHIHWLAKGNPGGHIEWGFLDDEKLQNIYEEKLAELGKCDSIIAMISKE